MYYNVIRILYALLCRQNFILVKSGRYTIHLQERLGQCPNLSYNKLVSAAIDQERPMRLIVEADEKKMVPGSSSSGGSSGAPPKYRMMYTTPRGQLRQPQ
jgi:hypothetical protein